MTKYERMPANCDIGKQVRQMRFERQWSTDHLSGLAGVSRNSLVELEAGRNVMVNTLVLVLRALGYRLVPEKMSNDPYRT